MKYGLIFRWKKIRSKILIDIGSFFKLDYKTLITIGVQLLNVFMLIH